jgi:hypothetical protein
MEAYIAETDIKCAVHKPSLSDLSHEKRRRACDHLRERMTDPFEVEEHPEALINFSTGMHAS